jgi:hypothetical protein
LRGLYPTRSGLVGRSTQLRSIFLGKSNQKVVGDNEGYFTLWPMSMTMKFFKALETHLKALPWRIDFELCVMTDVQVECKDICNEAPKQMLFPYNLIHVRPSAQ